MIKRLIFDVDGTLICGSDYTSAIKEILFEFDIYSEDNVNRMFTAIRSYEQYYDHYSKEDYLKFLGMHLDIALDSDFIESFFEKLRYVIPKYNEELVQTISNLSKHYEMVLLTNYFEESQRNRLEEMHINSFFTECYGEKKIKPNKEGYLAACGNHLPSECVMIGDNLELDVIVPIELGMHAIWVTNSDQEIDGVRKVKKVENLIEYL